MTMQLYPTITVEYSDTEEQETVDTKTFSLSDFEELLETRPFLIVAIDNIPEKTVMPLWNTPVITYLTDVYDYIDTVKKSYLKQSVFDAGLEIGFSIEEIEDLYCGTFSCDEDFARELAEQTNDRTDFETWPFDYIDWEAATKQLMWSSSYVENNGHYFYKA